MNRCAPWWTATLLALALLVWFWPTGFHWLVFKREAVLEGDVWRLWSGHLVHFTGSHLAANLLAVGVLGYLLERAGGARLLALFLLVPPLISLALLAGQPQLLFYGGLSGLASALAAWACVEGLMAGRWRRAWVLGLGLLVAKTLWDLGGGSLLTTAAEQPFVPVPLAHLVGALAGAAGAWVTRCCRSAPRMCRWAR